MTFVRFDKMTGRGGRKKLFNTISISTPSQMVIATNLIPANAVTVVFFYDKDTKKLGLKFADTKDINGHRLFVCKRRGPSPVVSCSALIKQLNLQKGRLTAQYDADIGMVIVDLNQKEAGEL